MTDNKLLLWSIIVAAIYWATGLVFPDYHSTFSSAMLLVFGGVTLARYGPEAWRVVIYRRRHPDTIGDGSHLAAYGVALLSLGSCYVGLFGVLWVLKGQPDNWLGTPVSGFGRYIMAAGFALLFFSPDMEQHRLRLPGRAWLLFALAVALVLSFFLGLRIGSTEQPELRTVTACPQSLPVKAKRNGIFHSPGGKYYDQTNPDACFGSAKFAAALGLRQGRK